GTEVKALVAGKAERARRREQPDDVGESEAGADQVVAGMTLPERDPLPSDAGGRRRALARDRLVARRRSLVHLRRPAQYGTIRTSSTPVARYRVRSGYCACKHSFAPSPRSMAMMTSSFG